MLIARVRASAAATVPTGAGLAELAAAALSRQGQEMTTDDIQRLAADAITQAQKLSFLMGQLAGLLDDGGSGG
jgi:hypothetical protein